MVQDHKALMIQVHMVLDHVSQGQNVKKVVNTMTFAQVYNISVHRRISWGIGVISTQSWTNLTYFVIFSLFLANIPNVENGSTLLSVCVV